MALSLQKTSLVEWNEPSRRSSSLSASLRCTSEHVENEDTIPQKENLGWPLLSSHIENLKNINVQVKRQRYSLNLVKTLTNVKKELASPYDVAVESKLKNNIRIYLNPAAYFAIINSLIKLLLTKSMYTSDTVIKTDDEGHVVEALVKLKSTVNSAINYTVNMYHTKCSILVNGPGSFKFCSEDLPVTVNSCVQFCKSKSIDFTKFKSKLLNSIQSTIQDLQQQPEIRKQDKVKAKSSKVVKHAAGDATNSIANSTNNTPNMEDKQHNSSRIFQAAQPITDGTDAVLKITGNHTPTIHIEEESNTTLASPTTIVPKALEFQDHPQAVNPSSQDDTIINGNSALVSTSVAQNANKSIHRPQAADARLQQHDNRSISHPHSTPQLEPTEQNKDSENCHDCGQSIDNPAETFHCDICNMPCHDKCSYPVHETPENPNCRSCQNILAMTNTSASTDRCTSQPTAVNSQGVASTDKDKNLAPSDKEKEIKNLNKKLKQQEKALKYETNRAAEYIAAVPKLEDQVKAQKETIAKLTMLINANNAQENTPSGNLCESNAQENTPDENLPHRSQTRTPHEEASRNQPYSCNNLHNNCQSRISMLERELEQLKIRDYINQRIEISNIQTTLQRMQTPAHPIQINPAYCLPAGFMPMMTPYQAIPLNQFYAQPYVQQVYPAHNPSMNFPPNVYQMHQHYPARMNVPFSTGIIPQQHQFPVPQTESHRPRHPPTSQSKPTRSNENDKYMSEPIKLVRNEDVRQKTAATTEHQNHETSKNNVPIKAQEKVRQQQVTDYQTTSTDSPPSQGAASSSNKDPFRFASLENNSRFQ